MFKKQNSSTSSASITPKDTSSIAKVLDKLKGHNLNNGSVKFNPGENGLVFKYVTNLFMATVKRDSISFLINPMSGSILNIVDAKMRKHRTFNSQLSTSNPIAVIGRWMFDVGCWMFKIYERRTYH